MVDGISHDLEGWANGGDERVWGRIGVC